jgi:hypothetical protein
MSSSSTASASIDEPESVPELAVANPAAAVPDGYVDTNLLEWRLVGPIISQSKGVHKHLRFLTIPQLLKRSLDVGVPKKARKAAGKDREALVKAIMAVRMANPAPPEFWCRHEPPIKPKASDKAKSDPALSHQELQKVLPRLMRECLGPV